MPSTVPTVDSLDAIYPTTALAAQGQRWNTLLTAFRKTYDKPADFVARCPGRVNVIGEHIDYSLYEVLPMAVTVDLLIAVSVVHPADSTTTTTTTTTESTVRIANLVEDKFPSRTFTIPHQGDVVIDDTQHEWSNYFKSGLRGAIDLLRSKGLPAGNNPVGMDVMVHGIVPSGGGLSSSAAFTCASALATLAANGVSEVDKSELVSLAIVSERYVGVNSGGMDQTASVFGEKGHALYVSFTPELKATPFSFPETDPKLTFVIAQTFVQADKRTTAPVNYNLRVVECTLAAEVLAKKHGLVLPADGGPLGSTLRGFHRKYFEKQGNGATDDIANDDFETQLTTMLGIVRDDLDKQDGYTKEEISEIVGMSVTDMEAKYMTKFPVRTAKYQLQKRALHVFNEALRVLLFKKTLLHAPANASLKYLETLGEFMNDSQASCRDQFDCSCPELDEMCRIARSAGAVGSRLTGAGWGGCSVHLVPWDRLEDVKGAWKKEYYEKRHPDVLERKGGWEEAVVVSEPGSGAVIFRGIVEPEKADGSSG